MSLDHGTREIEISGYLACVECGSISLDKIARGAEIECVRAGVGYVGLADIFECRDCGTLLGLGLVDGAYRFWSVKVIENWGKGLLGAAGEIDEHLSG